MTRVDWQQLGAEGLPLDTLAELARRHGLDLPHWPAIRPTPGDAGRWVPYCQGCTVRLGRMIDRCLAGAWHVPAELVDPAPVLADVDRALAELDGRAA